MVEKLLPDTFLKNQNWAYLWIKILNFYIFCFYCLTSWGSSKKIETKLQTTCIYLKKAFLKNKKRSTTSLPASFSAWFLKKNISLVIFFYLAEIQCLVAFTLRDIGQYVYCNSLLTRLWRKFWDSPYLSNQAVFLTSPKSQSKNLNILKANRAFKIK